MNSIIDLQNFFPKDAEKIMSKLRNYPKYRSLVAMAISGLPIPKAFIIITLDETAKHFCEKTLINWKVIEVSVRTDRAGGAVNAPSVQGCKIANVWGQIELFFKKNYLPMVISAGDIFHNTFSANFVIDPKNSQSINFESVGPGFCASDITKRDILTETGKIINGNLAVTQVVDNRTYKKQVNLMMKNQIHKEEENRKKLFGNAKDARLWAMQFLEAQNALILKHLIFKPVANNYAKQIWNFVPLMLQAGALMGYSNEPFIVSMAFVFENGREKPYFWDIHPYNGYGN